MKSLRQAALCLALFAGCDDDEAELDPAMDAAVDAALDASGLTPEQRASVDLLFVIDNSGSMGSRQQRLARELPRFVDGLVRGELGGRTFTPVRSLHVGVVTTNLGGFDERELMGPDGFMRCYGMGDDGLLQTSVSVARDGYTARAGIAQLPPYTRVVLAPDPACDLALQPSYQDFAPGRSDATALGCVARVGVRGCAMEQALESMWRALAPSAKLEADALYRFSELDGGQGGQGDRANAGFLREHAALAVVVVTDEDDCSLTREGRALFSDSPAAETKYGPLGLRCGKYADDPTMLQPVERYLKGLRALKPTHPERVVFSALTGVPMAAITQGLDAAAILALPEMKFEVDPQNEGLPKALCSVAAEPHPMDFGGPFYDHAYPATRLVKLAQAFEGQAVLGSLCGDDVRGALERTAAKLAPLLE